MDKEKYSFRIYSEHLPPKKTEKKVEKNNKKKKPCIAHRREKILWVELFISSTLHSTGKKKKTAPLGATTCNKSQ